MSTISTLIAQARAFVTTLRSSIWAIDVRDGIANSIQKLSEAIEQCYSDVSNPTLQTEALEAALQNKIDEGEMAALTIGDHTITAAKLAQGVIDNTLATSGAAADAAETGRQFGLIKADLGYLYPGEYDVVSGVYIDRTASALKAIPSGSSYSECVICIKAEPGKIYKVVKKTKTIMRVGVGSSGSLGADDPLVGIEYHTSQSKGDTPLYVSTDAGHAYIYIQLFTGDASADYRTIAANISTLVVNEDFSKELTESGGITADAKLAILNCFAHLSGWENGNGQEYYDALEDALYGELTAISAVFNPGQNEINNTTPLNDLKQYLTVTGTYKDGTTKTLTSYTLSGTLTVGTSTITVSNGSKSTTFDCTVVNYWTYEWNYTDGLPDQNGLTKNVTGNVAETLTDNGLRVQVENASDKRVNYILTPDSTKVYTHAVYELEFKVTTYGSYSYLPYVNGVKMNCTLGSRNGNAVKCAQLTFDESGTLYLQDGDTKWAALDSTPFETGKWYKVRAEQSTSKCDIYVDDVYVGSVPVEIGRETTSTARFIAYRTTDMLFKSFKARLVV